MIDLDAFCCQTLDRQRSLLDQAAHVRPIAHADRGPGASPRRWLALAMRRWADRLEPARNRASIGTLRALAHGEIDVDQALLLLDRRAGG